MNWLNMLRFQNWISAPISALLLMALACGAASTPTPQVIEKPVPAPQVVTKEVLVVATPTPTPSVSAAERALSSGKVTFMVGRLANERFDQRFAGAGGNVYGRVLHSHLLSTNEKLQLLPGIASAWNLSQDGRTWTITVRKGVKFHDGTDLTAEDVLWTTRYYWSPEALKFALSGQSDIRNVERLEQTGPNKVSITTKAPRPGFLLDLLSEAGVDWYTILPKRAKLYDEEAEAAYDRNPVGAGVMKLVKHVPAFLMAFERFDDYYYQPKNGLPEDKRVNFRWLDLLLIGEESTRVAAIRAGQADIAPVSLGAKKQVEAGGGVLVFGQEGSYLWITLKGCWKPEFPCHDRRVRQALNYAIDKELIRDKLYGGPEVMQVKGWSGVTSRTIGYSPELDPVPFDPKRARQLLADAGYPEGKGFGKLIIHTWVSTTAPLLPEAAQLGAEFWKRELGIDVEVKVGDEQALKKDERAGKLDGGIVWRDNEARIDASSNTDVSYGDPKSNRLAHKDPEIFDLVQKTLAVIDPQEREKAFNTMFRRLRDEGYQISIGYLNIPWAVGPRVSKWNPYPMSPYPSAMHTITLK